MDFGQGKIHKCSVRSPNPNIYSALGTAFSSIMFAFAGAGTFPTIQADMRDREKFPTAAVFAMISKITSEMIEMFMNMNKSVAQFYVVSTYPCLWLVGGSSETGLAPAWWILCVTAR